MPARILIIEDEDDLRDNVADLLELEGYSVLQAADGREGLRLAATAHPDLVLCDVMMPEMDGPAVLRALRARPDTLTLPFIFVTAQAEARNVRTGMNLGADDYLAKPFTDAELLRSIGARLERHRSLAAQDQAARQQLRSDLTQVIPHELRTPLVTILGCTQLLRDEWRELDADFAEQLLDDVYRAGSRMERFVENFSLYAQLELVARDADLCAGFLADNLSDAREALTTQPFVVAVRHGRADDLRVEATPARVRMAGAHLSKLVGEIVDNAFKFSPPGTPVLVEGAREGSSYVVCVQDAGRGLTPEQSGQVGAFVQFDRGQHEQQGLGLGLHLARTLATLHGGTLALDSAPGRGTRATLRLPLD